MAAQRELVRLLARDAELPRQVFRRKPHAEIGVGIVVHQIRVRRKMESTHGNEAHGLSPAGDNAAAHAGHNALGSQRDGLQA